MKMKKWSSLDYSLKMGSSNFFLFTVTSVKLKFGALCTVGIQGALMSKIYIARAT
jgi:hypothetical protein